MCFQPATQLSVRGLELVCNMASNQVMLSTEFLGTFKELGSYCKVQILAHPPTKAFRATILAVPVLGTREPD